MTDYNEFAKTFSKSREHMQWPEIDYFISQHTHHLLSKNILDIGCGSGRLLEQLSNHFDIQPIDYTGVDISEELLRVAQNKYPHKIFFHIDMKDIDRLNNQKFDFIFFIASFHHLKDIQTRGEVLQKTKNLLNKDGKIFFTNWALNSQLNHTKYLKDMIKSSYNTFGSLDYHIKIGNHIRYYHSFSLKELEYLFLESGFTILENREFENKRNLISIVTKI